MAELEVSRKAKNATTDAKAQQFVVKPAQQSPQAQDIPAKPVQPTRQNPLTAVTAEQNLTDKLVEDQVQRYFVLNAVWQSCQWGEGVRKTQQRANEMLPDDPKMSK